MSVQTRNSTELLSITNPQRESNMLAKYNNGGWGGGGGGGWLVVALCTHIYI